MIMINLTVRDKDKLSISSKQNNPWDYLSNNGSYTKNKIKTHIKERTLLRARRQTLTCSYCQLAITNARNDAFDIDHILPISVSLFKCKSFSFKNLAVSCSRCNRTIKSDDYSFYIGKSKRDSNKSANYSIIHPFYDNIKCHLKVREIYDNVNNINLVIYKIVNNSPKGHTTYDYFKLQDLVKDSLISSLGIRKISYENVYDQLSNL
ncbi:HNH endonuclease [Leptospira saintgironsiae]|uniref:HNH nuclease domain-containing protein n=1 Tax=Leptospira saintgironsiae TaxID=2023183 RepID=A0A2M9Y7K6_9LEPT|nr:hypothetical protein CH362_18930 [Leptospira saintgironsiae]